MEMGQWLPCSFPHCVNLISKSINNAVRIQLFLLRNLPNKQKSFHAIIELVVQENGAFFRAPFVFQIAGR